MFNFFKNVSGRPRTEIRLDKQEQNELMTKISQADDFKDAEIYFNRLYDSLLHPLWANFSAKYVPPLTHEDLRDVFQEAWVKLLDKRKSYDGNSNVYNWIYVIKKNMIIDKIRKMNRYEETSIDERNEKEDEPEFEIPEHELSSEDKYVEDETTQLIRNTLENINDESIKEMLKRRIVMDQKLEQISEDMDVPVSTVHKKIKKGLQIIKPQIENILNS